MTDQIIPENATIRQEYITCGKVNCEKQHGPYLYAYWKEKENHKLKKIYVGKSLEEYYYKQSIRVTNKVAGSDMTFTQWKKMEYILKHSNQGNSFAEEYLKKVDKKQVSVEWAYKQVRDQIGFSRILKAKQLAKKKGFEYETNSKLVHLIGKDMESKGIDITEDNVDSYLNSEFM